MAEDIPISGGQLQESRSPSGLPTVCSLNIEDTPSSSSEQHSMGDQEDGMPVSGNASLGNDRGSIFALLEAVTQPRKEEVAAIKDAAGAEEDFPEYTTGHSSFDINQSREAECDSSDLSPEGRPPSPVSSTEKQTDPSSTASSVTTDGVGEVPLASDPKDSKDEPPANIAEQEVFNIVAIPGKGLGAIATTAIRRGTRILTEAPMIRLNQPSWDDPKSREEQFDDLSDEVKQRVLSLYNYREDMGALAGIIFTNAIPLHGRYPECGLFIEASRINHSCKPNSLHTWDATSDTMVTYATRDIEAGEEITSSYIDGFGAFDVRQRHLKLTFGFVCDCALCSLGPEERARSDIRISKIGQLKAKLGELTPRPAPVPTLKYIREILQLYREEDIVDDHPRDAYRLAEQAMKHRKDWRRLVVFTERRENLEAAFGGSDITIEAYGIEAELQRTVARCWRNTAGKGGGYWPVVEGDGMEFEDWLFQEDDWRSLRHKYPSIYMAKASSDG